MAGRHHAHLRRFRLLIVGLLASAASSAAAQEWTEGELSDLRAKFILLDIDGDEQVTFLDMAQERLRQFNRIDDNNDKFVSIGEWMGYRAPGAEKYLTRREYELRRWSFYKTDFDLDRRLSNEEFVFETRKSFNNLDVNRDGIVTFEEFARLPLPRDRGRNRPTFE